MKKIFFVLITALILLSGCICPPSNWEGPWPPWCEKPTIGESGVSSVAQTGTPVKVIFETSLPKTNEKVYLNLDEKQYELQPRTNYLFESEEIECEIGKEITYYFSSESKRTADQVSTCDYTGEVRTGLAWTDSKNYSKAGFVKGHVVMDAGGYIVNEIRSGNISSTQDEMIQDEGGWFAYDYYWGYTDTEKPSIIDQTEENPDTFMTNSDLVKLANGTHKKGMKMMLVTELEWIITQDVRDSYDDWDTFIDYQNGVWSDGQIFLKDMGYRIEQDPNDAEAKKYWDDWFVEFEEFMIHSAEYAEANDVEMLVLGKQIDGANTPALEDKWRTLISKVRGVYSGKIAQAPFVNENTNLVYEMPWADDLDYVIVYYYNNFSNERNPSIETLKTSMERFNETQFDPFFETYKTDLVFMTPFQSRDYAAKQVWFEPMSSGEGVELDLEGQANLYEAFFESTIDEDWFAGLMTWGYWTNQELNLPEAFEKSSSVRGKPASLVIRKWFSQIEN